MKKLYRVLALVLSVIIIASSLMGCKKESDLSSDGKSNTEAKNDTEKKDENNASSKDDSKKERTVLRIWHGFTSETTKPVIEEIFERYNSVQNEVTIVYDAFSSSDLLQAYTLGAVSGELPDIGTNDNPAWTSLCAMGVFASIDDWFESWDEKDKILESTLASGYYNGELYGVPFGPNCLALWCNTDMLEEAGYTKPPTTFEEFVEIAEATTKPEEGVYGFVMGGFKNEAGTFQNLPWLISAGGSIFDLTSDASKSALTMLKDLFDKGCISKESLNWTQSDALNQFIAGNAAMYLSGSWNVATIRNTAPDIRFTCSPIPKGVDSVSCLGGELIGITTACRNVEAAQDFLEWFLSYDINKEFAQRCTRFSPRSDITAEDLYPGDDVMAVYADLLPNAYARGQHPAWNEVSTVFQNAYQEIYTGAKSVDDAVNEAAKQINDILAKYE